MNGTSESKRPRLSDSAETHAITTFDNSFEGIKGDDRVALECRVAAGLLGAGPLDIKSLVIDEAWITKLYEILKSRVVSPEALVRYFKIVATGGTVTEPIHDSVTNGASLDTPRSFRVYQVPHILRSPQIGKGFTAEFVEYAKRFTGPDFSIRTIMDDARRILMANRVKYFGDELCEVVVDIPDFGKIRATVRDAFEMIDPNFRGQACIVLSPGSNLKEWVVQVGKGVGSARTKKEARMIAMVRDQIDPDFTGEAPVRVTGASSSGISFHGEVLGDD